MDTLRGPALVPGDRVRLVSPASFPDWDAIDGYVAHLESWGLVAELGEHLMDQLGFMAGPDEVRLADLHAAFRDPGVRAVVTAHGGAGAYRIADALDFDAIRRDPKPLVGFSDITALHLALSAHGIASVHGMMYGDIPAASLRGVLMSAEPLTHRSDPANGTGAVRVSGVATGVLVGGHLPTVLNSVGAGLPSLAGAILLVEDNLTNGVAGLDRDLAHLRRSRVLDGVGGIALGHIVGGGADGREPEPDGWSIVDVLEQHLGELGVPVLGGLPFGHVPDQLNVPLGTTATLDADAGTLTVTAAVR
jgi:muramoyltetrapeptide carboxypeptidase